MQVQLWNTVAKCGEVDFGTVKMLFDEARDHGALPHDLITLPGGQVQQIGAVHFRHQYEPGDQSVLVQQYMAVFQPAQEAGVGKQLVMYCKLLQG